MSSWLLQAIAIVAVGLSLWTSSAAAVDPATTTIIPPVTTMGSTTPQPSTIPNTGGWSWSITSNRTSNPIINATGYVVYTCMAGNHKTEILNVRLTDDFERVRKRGVILHARMNFTSCVGTVNESSTVIITHSCAFNAIYKLKIDGTIVKLSQDPNPKIPRVGGDMAYADPDCGTAYMRGPSPTTPGQCYSEVTIRDNSDCDHHKSINNATNATLVDPAGIIIDPLYWGIEDSDLGSSYMAETFIPFIVFTVILIAVVIGFGVRKMRGGDPSASR